jgi:hypothetical protein
MAKTEKHYVCGDCDHPFSESDAGGPVYECSTDGQPQVDERRCQQCNKFCAKVADMSCPECEAYEDIRETTQEAFGMAQEREQKEKMEREERRRNPKPDPVYERIKVEMEQHRQRMCEWWEESGRQAFADLVGGKLADRIEKYLVQSGGSSISLETEEVKEIGEKLTMLEQQVREWSGVDDLDG